MNRQHHSCNQPKGLSPKERAAVNEICSKEDRSEDREPKPPHELAGTHSAFSRPYCTRGDYTANQNIKEIVSGCSIPTRVPGRGKQSRGGRRAYDAAE